MWYSMVPMRIVVARGDVEELFDEEGGGGFAVGASDAGGGEFFLWMAEEGGGGFGKGATAMLDFEDGNFWIVDKQMIEGGRGVGDDAKSARGEGLFDVAIAVGGAAFHGDEDGTGLDAARVVFDAADGFGGVAGGTHGLHFRDEVFPEHDKGDCSGRGKSIFLNRHLDKSFRHLQRYGGSGVVRRLSPEI